MRGKFLLIFFLSFWTLAQAQTTNTSLYSRFALGELHTPITVSQMGMSGLSYGLAEPMMVNYNNPASLAFISQPTFSVGIKAERVTASSLENTQTNSLTRFDHFILAFPFAKRKGGIALGMSPFSSVNYQYRDSSFIAGVEDPVRSTYSGSGGLNTMFLKGGYKMILAKDTSMFNQHTYLSLGLGFNYNFGSLINTKRIEFPGGEGFVNSFVADNTTYGDVGFDYSLMFKTYLKKKKSRKDGSTILNLGLNFHPKTQLSGEKNVDIFSYLVNSLGVESTIDSISSFRDQEGYAILPSKLGVGFTLSHFYKKKEASFLRNLLVGVDYSINNWDEFETSFNQFDDHSEVTSSSTLVAGLSYLPNINYSSSNVSNYFQICTYRLGYRASQLNLMIDNQTINESGINLGISLPLVYGLKYKASDTSIDLGVGYGTRGGTENGLVKEDYIHFMLGISFRPLGRDLWFVKRKYD